MGTEAEVLKQALADAKASLQRGWAAWAAREAELVEARKEAAENARRAEEKAEALAAAQGALEMRGNELGATRDRIREVEAAVAAVVKAQSEVNVSVEVASSSLQP